jgi:hypothetical protein
VDQQAQPVLQGQQDLKDGLGQQAQLGQTVQLAQLAQLDLKGGLVQRAQLGLPEVQVVLHYNHHIQMVIIHR